MSGPLVRFNNARKALAACVRVDECKTIRDKAVALQAYARQAKDTELINHATEVRLRAERRAGELLRDMAQNGERATRKGNLRKGQSPKSHRATSEPRLSDIGVSKSQSSRWQKLAAEPEPAFEKRVTKVKAVAVASVTDPAAVIRAARDERLALQKANRERRERDLADRIAELPQRRFGVILADPEWKFDVWSERGMERNPANHYPTSGLDAIKGRDVPSISADDAVLFLWATIPMLPEALEVMAAWDFKYKSHHAWVKPSPGTGYWNREQHELLLIGVRGNVPCPAMGTQWPSVIEAPRGKVHSAKPECVLEMIEQYYPNVPKIELNRRGPARVGWSAWGNEVEQDSVELRA